MVKCLYQTSLAQYRWSNQPHTGVGEAVEVANGNVFIGEPSNVQIPRAVYIFSKQEEEWTQKFAIKAEDGEVGDGFGSSLLLLGIY